MYHLANDRRVGLQQFFLIGLGQVCLLVSTRRFHLLRMVILLGGLLIKIGGGFGHFGSNLFTRLGLQVRVQHRLEWRLSLPLPSFAQLVAGLVPAVRISS